jgi:predicted aldo/keto reductase-like oxidoreductase
MAATSQRAVDEIVAHALDLGITYFDIVDVYGDTPGSSETLLGNLAATQWRPTEQEVAALGAILPRDLSGGPGRVTGSVAPAGVAAQ